jgi:hypothetical protein
VDEPAVRVESPVEFGGRIRWPELTMDFGWAVACGNKRESERPSALFAGGDAL